jgi:hypothetical protein
VNLSSDSSEGVIPDNSLPTPRLAILRVVSTQSLSLLLLVHLVIPISLTPHSTPILVNVLVSWSALDAWPHFLDPGTN